MFARREFLSAPRLHGSSSPFRRLHRGDNYPDTAGPSVGRCCERTWREPRPVPKHWHALQVVVVNPQLSFSSAAGDG